MYQKHIHNLIVALLLLLCTHTPTILADELTPNMHKPFGVFFALHMETGSYAPDFEYQERYWPNLVRCIAIADKHHAKMTLMFNPQWAEYILMDQARFLMVKEWQRNGHEVGLHYHLVTHRDWCGYTNRIDPIYVDSEKYRGTVEDMMVLLQELAAPEPVLTACSGPDIVTELYPFTYPVASGFIEETDFPDEIIYDVDGIHDGRTNPIHFEFKGKSRYHLRHGVAISKENIEQRLQEIASAEPDEIVGLVTHASDYSPELIDRMFTFLTKHKTQVHTVNDIMEVYLNTKR